MRRKIAQTTREKVKKCRVLTPTNPPLKGGGRKKAIYTEGRGINIIR